MGGYQLRYINWNTFWSNVPAIELEFSLFLVNNKTDLPSRLKHWSTTLWPWPTRETWTATKYRSGVCSFCQSITDEAEKELNPEGTSLRDLESCYRYKTILRIEGKAMSFIRDTPPSSHLSLAVNRFQHNNQVVNVFV